MSEDQQRLELLMQKYRDKNISYEEYLELFEYIGAAGTREEVLDLMDKQFKVLNPDADVHDIDWDGVYKNITSHKAGGGIAVFKLWKYLVAASVVLVMGLFVYKYYTGKGEREGKFAAGKGTGSDALPAARRAILELADGSVLTLSEDKEGVLATQGGSSVTKTREGGLVYNDMKDHSGKELVYNTIVTPRGGTYQLTLPDGSKIWLNAASSLRFPASFGGNERKVELKGEAYFEVAKDQSKPFIVKAGPSEIRVLGTHFNIMAYASEPLSQTTLIEGSVQYTSQGYQHIMAPGEQATYNNSSGTVKISRVKTEDAVAWKNGLFVFSNTPVREIMKDISRWYDVDINYADGMPDVYFTGVIPRDVNVSKVLKVLENTGEVDFVIKDKLITCSKGKK